jgi:hypothetical protein
MSAIIGRVADVQPHAESDTLDVVTIGGHTNVANREGSQPRYAVGDFAVMLTENLILPDWLLKHLDLWNEVKGKGYLAGGKGDRTKGRKVAGILSDVALCKIDWSMDESHSLCGHDRHRRLHPPGLNGRPFSAKGRSTDRPFLCCTC